ncbi:MAG: DegT/DnrJ/EryC1/StrS family aminotransferase [Verrucomicrobia bacterium]|nr:DegT/DnrJ/EryC1/StrS family aminotransferase [Verrucomicrobiota bacterium]
MSAKQQTPVKFFDLQAQFGTIRNEAMAAIHEVVESQQFILGPKVAELEARMADYCGCAHAVGVSSGTDALLVALMALGIGPGDEVITSTFSFFASAGSIYRLGAKPVFVDIDPETYNVDPAKVEAAITPRTKAIMPVHLFGQCADMTAVMEIASKRGIPVVEDAAQAIGAEQAGKRAGSFGAFGCFSFFPTKNLGAFGEGGMITTNDKELADRARMLRHHGDRGRYDHVLVGGNFRLQALQAAVLLVKLGHLDEWTVQRQTNASLYRKLLAEAGLVQSCDGAARTDVGRGPLAPPRLAAERDSSPKTGGARGPRPTSPDDTAVAGSRGAFVTLPAERPGRHTYNQFVIEVGRRDALCAFLNERGIGHSIYYPVPLHLQPCFSALGYKLGDFPLAERACSRVLALPIYPELPSGAAERVVEAIAEFLTS